MEARAAALIGVLFALPLTSFGFIVVVFPQNVFRSLMCTNIIKYAKEVSVLFMLLLVVVFAARRGL